MSTHFDHIHAATAREWLNDQREIAFLDVREAGEFGEGHPFFAIPAPYSRLEIEVPRLVPRKATRIVLIDGADGTAERAATRLAALGYSQLHVIQDGTKAWAASGFTLFQGVNLPSKTFGELVEHALGTPRITAQELQARQNAGRQMVLVDGRTFAEHQKMTIPGASSLPNGELARHWREQVSDDFTPIIVHCAGRTRSIIGAEILRSIGIRNPVFALENGTQGWALSGLQLEHGSTRKATTAPTANHEDQAAAERLARSTGVQHLSAQQAQAWIDDASRTTFVLDIRSAEEFAAGTLPGASHAPGGQLLQATDQTIGVRNARILLLDDEGLRAPVIAAWLWRLGHETATVEGGIRAALQLPAQTLPSLEQQATRIAPELLADWVASHNPRLLDVQSSTHYRNRHAADSRWTIRPWLHREIPQDDKPLLLIASDADIAELAALDLHDAGNKHIAWAHIDDWIAAGLPTQTTPDQPSDKDSIDYLFFVHDRHDGNLDAARRYLEWETGLIAQCAPDELAVFRLPNSETPESQEHATESA